MRILLEIAWCIVNDEHWDEERAHLQKVFQMNIFSNSENNKTFASFDQKRVWYEMKKRGNKPEGL